MNIGQTGFDGENSAVKYLKSKHYKIIARNYQTRYGEIDIVCSKGEYIVFAELMRQAVVHLQVRYMPRQ